MDAQDKIRYLRLCTPASLPAIFKVEIPSTVLTDIVDALVASCSALTADDGDIHAFALEVLAGLQGAGRFNLNSRLLAPKSRQGLRELLQRLGKDRLDLQDRAAAVAAAYGV